MKKLIGLLFAVIFGLLAGFESVQLSSGSTLFTSYLANVIFEHNFHAVIPGRLYRSGAMSDRELAETVRQNGISTVIDLRISEIDQNDVVAAEGAHRIHVPLAGTRIPSPSEVQRLISAFDSASEPVLVHCSSGTHRSGVASAIWMLYKEHASLAEARRQLSSEYGFFSWERDLKSLWQGHPTIDHLIDLIAKADARGIGFQAWLEQYTQRRH